MYPCVSHTTCLYKYQSQPNPSSVVNVDNDVDTVVMHGWDRHHESVTFELYKQKKASRKFRNCPKYIRIVDIP